MDAETKELVAIVLENLAVGFHQGVFTIPNERVAGISRKDIVDTLVKLHDRVKPAPNVTFWPTTMGEA
jgi:hypothetical protein